MMEEQTGADSNRPEAATESPMSAVSALMAERRKFEGWISSLEARRSTTPERVFTRVHGDYSTRLDRVMEQLTSHSGGLRDELDSLTMRVGELDTEQQQARDERDEAELRAHVGELSAADWETVQRTSDARISALSERHTQLSDELERTRELLSEAVRPVTPPTGSMPGILLMGVSPGSSADLGTEASITAADDTLDSVPDQAEGALHVPSADTAPLPADALVGGGDEEPMELSAAVIAAEAELMDDDERSSEPPVSGAAASEAAGTDPVGQQPPARGRSNTGGFDEMAFLSSVVNTPSGTLDSAPTERADEAARRDSFATRAHDDEIVNLTDATPPAMPASLADRAAQNASPLASNVSGNIPIVLRDRSAEASKTLKCSECGAMNYPTEWYCERCGAELASL